MTVRELRRERCFRILGGAQCKCGFSDRRALQFDHITGLVGKRRKVGSALFQDIEQQPEKYQVLCSNCNWIKRYENGETQNSAAWPEKKRREASQFMRKSWKKNRKRIVEGLRRAWADPETRARRVKSLRASPTRYSWTSTSAREAGARGLISRWGVKC